MRKLTFQTAIMVRIGADLAILNAALFGGLVLSRSFVAWVGRPSTAILIPFSRGFWALSIIGIVTFALQGFYTRGRAYASRYKRLIILQATTLTFLIFGFSGYVTPVVGGIGRPALLMAWCLACVGLVLARFSGVIWKYLSSVESFIGTVEVEDSLPGMPGAVLLIGGAGYIGSALIPRLLKTGYRIRLLDAFLYGREPIAEWANHPNLQIVKADFRRVDAVVRAMRGVNTVIHLGAIVGDPACALDEELTVETNLLATRMIAEVTKGQGIKRFIFASTCSVYGASNLRLDEHSRLNPVSLYARSKIACENVLLNMKSDSFHPIILRFGTIYGLSGRTRFDLVVNLLTAKAIVEGVITVFGSDQWRPFLHVSDAAQAIHLACRAPYQALQESIFNVGSDEQNYTLGEVGRIIKSIVPAAEIQTIEENVDRRNYRVNFGRIERCLPFKPEWTLEMGILQVLEAIRSGRVADYKDSRYSNVRFLSEEIGPELLRFGQYSWAQTALQGLNGPESATGTEPAQGFAAAR